MMSSGYSALPESSPKRRRISQSCSTCRHKKTRCDGQRPACLSCRTKGLDCKYDKDSIVAIPSSTLASIESRLAKLEQQVSERSGERASQSEPLTSRDDGLYEKSAHTVQEVPTNTLISDLKPVAPLRTSALPKRSTGTFHRSTEIDTGCLQLPDKSDADVLLDSYARQVYPLFPMLHLPTLRTNYERIWQSPRPGKVSLITNDDIVSYATLNMILALGRLNSTSDEQRLSQEQAAAFYDRARCVLTLDAIDNPSLETVQYCLLTTMYLLFTSRFHRCHSAIGLAIRAAQSIGLDTAAETDPNQYRREMARRVWHSCMLMERLVCSLFGRRVNSFADSTVPLPMSVDDEQILDDRIEPKVPKTPSIIAAFLVSIKAFQIIEDARWITVPKEHISLNELTTVLQLNERLDHIQASLPTHLQRLKISGKARQGLRDDVFVLQHVAIMIRIAHVRLLLIRSCILEAARQHTSQQSDELGPPGTTDRLRIETCHICVKAATDTIELLNNNLHAPIRVMSCIALFTAFSAASVLVAASLVPELEARYQLPGERLSQAINVLTSHRWQIDGASSAKEQLEQFMETVEGIKERRGAVTVPTVTAEAEDGSALNMQSEAFFDFDLSDPLWNLDWESTVEYLGF